MYPDYGNCWESIYANPERVPPFQERIPSKSEIAYARLAAKIPHGVNKRLSLDLVQVKSTRSGRVIVTYRT